MKLTFLVKRDKQKGFNFVSSVKRSTVIDNDFVTPAPSLAPALSLAPSRPSFKFGQRISFNDALHRHSLAAYALLLLAIGLAATPIASRYLSAGIKLLPITSVKARHLSGGINEAVTAPDFPAWLQSITSQPASLNLGSQTVNINPGLIKNWLQITSSANKSQYDVHINSKLMASSLQALANKYVESPVNEVVATLDDGSSEVALSGQSGTKLSDPTSIAPQAQALAKNLFSNKGFQISAPLVSVPFQTLTPDSFGKLLLVDINSKKMYAYQNGQLVNTFLVSAGAPATPTPIGQFHIYEKLPLQNMSGYNPDGSKYFQPNVEWVNYFDGSDAVHGVYWHPLSWFGVHNSSHGCVGVPDDQAQWIYNWAPIGTTVITTTN